MPKIDKVSWGRVTIDDQKYHQALIIGEEVSERKSPQLKKLFQTTHRLGQWEKEQLLTGYPEIILIATGWRGVLKVDEEFKQLLNKKRIELREVLTPKVAREYHRLVEDGRKVNTLIHTTC